MRRFLPLKLGSMAKGQDAAARTGGSPAASPMARLRAFLWWALKFVGQFGIYHTIAFHTMDWCHPYPHHLYAKTTCTGPVRPSNTSGLLAVNAGFPKTGTTTIAEALMSIGWRVYRAPDHLEFLHHVFWTRIREEHLWQDAAVRGRWSELMAAGLSRCRVDALTLEPHLEWLPEVLEASPNVKVILGTRDFESWWVSVHRFNWKFKVWYYFLHWTYCGCRVLPWSHTLQLLTAGYIHNHVHEGGPELVREGSSYFGVFRSFAYSIWDYHWMGGLLQKYSEKGYAGVTNPNLVFTKEKAEAEKWYEAWHEYAQSIVPKENLLLFDVRRHGWKELCDFLGVPEPRIAFPHAQVTATGWKASAVAENNLLFFWCSVVMAFLIHLVNFLCLRELWRASRRRMRQWNASTEGRTKTE